MEERGSFFAFDLDERTTLIERIRDGIGRAEYLGLLW